MKNFKIVLSLVLFILSFSFTEAQTTEAKPKRTYVKKSEVPAATTPTAKPSRTYAKKTDNTVKPTTETENKNRTYTSNTKAKSPKAKTNTKAKTTKASKTSKAVATENGRTIYTGPRGGKYYINKNGNKTYIK